MDTPKVGETLGELVLERMKLIVLKSASTELVEEIERQALVDRVKAACSLHEFPGEVLFRFSVELWGAEAGRQTVSYPADWWQALKSRWFPGWATRWWPVRMEVRTIRAIDFFPRYYPDFLGKPARKVMELKKET